MLRHAADLSDAHEYFIIWVGGTNARPWGAKADAYKLFPEFELAAEGIDLVSATVDGSTTPITIEIGAGEALAKNQYAGATLRIGSKTAGGTGYGTISAHGAIVPPATTTADVEIVWSTPAPAGSAQRAAYIVRETSGTRKRGYYPQVRVLTPYQPLVDDPAVAVLNYLTPGVSGGAALTLPAPYTVPAAVTAFEDLGLLLPLTFFEGLGGWGVSDRGDSAANGAHALTSVAADVWSYDGTTTGHATDDLAGGYVIVDWETDGSVPSRSWSTITSSTAGSFTVSGTWLGDGAPDASPLTNVKRWTAWVPHWSDSPYAYLPGENYTYPNHDMMPCSHSDIGAAVRNTPREIGLSGDTAYADTFGALLPAASRLSAAIGKRVNVVNLAVTDATLAPGSDRNPTGFEGKLGWWDAESHGTWSPSDPFSLYSRLKKLLATVLPNALTIDQGAESHTRTLRCLGIVFAHGEADAVETGARQQYREMLDRFAYGVRKLVADQGYNPYATEAEIPFVQPRIAVLPNAIDGTYGRAAARGGGTVTLNADTQNLVNGAIEERAGRDEFGVSIKVDDLPRDATDPSIYSGVGEAELGARVGDALGRLVEHTLGYGSTAVQTSPTRIIDICNQALAAIGDAGQITSLTDGSAQATQCLRFLPEARDELLQLQQWTFALRRRQLVPVQMPEPGVYQHFEFCYVMPAEALCAFQVFGRHTDTDFDYEAVTTSGYEDDFVANDGSMVEREASTPSAQVFPGQPGGGGEGVSLVTDRLLPLVYDFALEPQAFKTEQSPDGGRYIFTNEPKATLQYTARVVDATQFSPLFASALAANLSARLASHFVKGKEGEVLAQVMYQKAAGYLRLAASHDATEQRPVNQRRPFGFTPDHLQHRDGLDASRTRSQGSTSNFRSGFNIL